MVDFQSMNIEELDQGLKVQLWDLFAMCITKTYITQTEVWQLFNAHGIELYTIQIVSVHVIADHVIVLNYCNMIFFNSIIRFFCRSMYVETTIKHVL